ncbi:rho GTPase-activating protein 18 isoform X2 [Pygocentrus nattereri]|uniref:rho GTPase-activating protein 18 isoform X2 n=1 Tax=Pygocentrus nattereri TaxID=42514 RepID=UPI000814AFDC|nr:rho GTPase-activating protein 18 isoform X2 [Pygocentrus nattereri]
MSRQQAVQGVVLTGYTSSSDAFPQPPASAPQHGAPAPRRVSQIAGVLLLTQQLRKRPEEATDLLCDVSCFGYSLRRTGHYNVQRARPGEKPPYQRCNSQDSLDELALDDYWKEVEIIQHTGDAEQQEEVQLKVADEGEQEEAWLTEAGLATLFDESAADGEDSMVLLSTLTRTQAAAVERRVETLKQTLRKRNKPYSVPDVRDIFKPSPALDTKDSESTSTEGSEHRKTEATSSGEHSGVGNGAEPGGGGAETETDINLEVSFSEQALSYRDGSKVTQPINEADDKLPDFKVVRDKTGMTKVGDLSAADMKKVRRLVLIEMTALFDTAGLDLKTHKPLKIRVKESGLFGVPLSTVLEQDQRRVPGTRVPLIMQRLISHIEEEGLHTEGLLRVPGASTRVKTVCHELELKFYDGLFLWETLKQHDAASLLKLFIRELPHPLLTVEYFSAFISVLKFPTKKQQLQALNLLVLLLPESSRDTLKALLEFLQRVIDHKEQNKMTLNNVAVVMAPNIFMFKGFRSKITEQQEFAMATGMANIVRLFIRYQNLLWTIPKFVMNQVRKQNTENQRKMNRDRAVKKLLKKMAYDREKNIEKVEKSSEAEGGIIRVQAPQFTKVSMAVQLTEELQASDILTRFLSQDSSVSVKREDLCLFEIGGNIKERCLDEETYMKALLELNPAAEWVIKSVQR